MGLFSTEHHHHHRHTDTVSVPYEKTVTIKEHRAPTDISVALLNEFTEKARLNIINKVVIEQNHIKAVAIYYTDDIVGNRINFDVRFVLNGIETTISDHVDKYDWDNSLMSSYFGFGIKEIFEKVHKKLAEMIALDLMKQSPEFMEELKRNDQ